MNPIGRLQQHGHAAGGFREMVAVKVGEFIAEGGKDPIVGGLAVTRDRDTPALHNDQSPPLIGCRRGR